MYNMGFRRVSVLIMRYMRGFLTKNKSFRKGFHVNYELHAKVSSSKTFFEGFPCWLWSTCEGCLHVCCFIQHHWQPTPVSHQSFFHKSSISQLAGVLGVAGSFQISIWRILYFPASGSQSGTVYGPKYHYSLGFLQCGAHVIFSKRAREECISMCLTDPYLP